MFVVWRSSVPAVCWCSLCDVCCVFVVCCLVFVFCCCVWFVVCCSLCDARCFLRVCLVVVCWLLFACALVAVCWLLFVGRCTLSCVGCWWSLPAAWCLLCCSMVFAV